MPKNPASKLRAFWVPAALSVLVLVVFGASLWLASRRSAERLGPVRVQLQNLEALHSSTSQLHDLLLQRLERQGRLDQRQLARIRTSLESLLLLDSFQAETTPAQLQQAQRLVQALERDPGGTGLVLLEILRDISIEEQKANRLLLDRASRDTQRFHTLLFAMSFGLPIAGGLSWILFLRRIRYPLRLLEGLLQDLGQPGRTKRIMNNRVDPLVEPLYAKYDEMVERLDQLEAERDEREQRLERRVREAASTLLAQQQALNSKERAAATGELAAQLAHDLKSPLAGIEVAISRLTRESSLAPYRERLDAIKREAGRASRMLSDLMARVRWTDEAATEFDLSAVVTELLELLSYQIPEEIELRSAVPAGQRVFLPEDRTRHVLLNVLMNAVEALTERPEPDGGSVVVRCQSNGEELVIEIEDDGPGFPKAVMRDGVRAFETQRDTGTGLGLVVVRRFAIDLAGRLELLNRSDDQGGAIVRLHLPQPAATSTLIEAEPRP
jgi:nitrogen fixation/metabolism regulation signal transduction histidine kinase